MGKGGDYLLLFDRQARAGALRSGSYIGDAVISIIVTRNTLQIDRQLLTIPELIVWDNAHGNDMKVFGRYMAIMQNPGSPVLVQDDDCLIDHQALIREYRGDELLVNMPKAFEECYLPMQIALVGFGAVFPRELVNFERYLAKWPLDDLFLRECDRVFTFLNWGKVRMVDIGVEHLPSAHADNRMWKESRHEQDLAEIRSRLRAL